MANVMVVDDENSVRITLGAFLENCGHHVVLAEDVNTAYELMETEALDVVVSDVLLPGITGIELLKSIKAIDNNVQVVMMTGQPTADTASEIVRGDAFDYLLKPIPKVKILDAVSRAARMKRILDEKSDLEEQNRRHRDELEQLVSERTEGLAESEEKFRGITSAARDAIFMIDKDCVVRFWNPSAERIFGYAAEEAIGKKANQFFPELRDPANCEACLSSNVSVEVTEGRTFDVTAERKDATSCPVELSASRVNIRGENHIVVIARDATLREQATEAMILAKEKAEAAARAKSEFLANMSHEIRTPMNAIIGMTELALDTSLTHEQREYLDTAMSSAEALLDLINSLLDFSKIEAGRLELESKPFNLRKLVEDTVRAIAVRAQVKGLEIACDIGTDVPEAVAGDSARLRQVIINLLGNAIKFTEDGEVVVRVERLSEPGEKARIDFSVSDTGIGIPADKQEKVFGSFEQADTGTSRKYGGTGLGLAISSQIVSHMGGTLKVQSPNPGAVSHGGEASPGSVFSFCIDLPIERDPLPDPGSVFPQRELRKMHVLVVDDSGVNRRIVRKTLETWGMLVEEAGSAGEARKKLEQTAENNNPFPIVLLDYQMPDANGLEVAEFIKEHPRLAGSTLMMLTSVESATLASRCSDLGVASCLTKPIRRQDLLMALLAALGNGPDVNQFPDSTQLLPACDSPQALRILLAEDNKVNQRMAVCMLEKDGHNVTVAVNGRQALDELSSHDFDLVLMDVQMPEMDGIEATRSIRSKTSTVRNPGIPIIAMTAHALKEDETRCLEAGMDGYITKPIRRQALLKTIRCYHEQPTSTVVRTLHEEIGSRV